MHDVQVLPRVRDSLAFLYVEHCRVEQEVRSVALFDKEGKVSVPCAALLALMLGPGTSITHAAVRTLAENGCSVICHTGKMLRFVYDMADLYKTDVAVSVAFSSLSAPRTEG